MGFDSCNEPAIVIHAQTNRFPTRRPSRVAQTCSFMSMPPSDCYTVPGRASLVSRTTSDLFGQPRQTISPSVHPSILLPAFTCNSGVGLFGGQVLVRLRRARCTQYCMQAHGCSYRSQLSTVSQLRQARQRSCSSMETQPEFIWYRQSHCGHCSV